MKNLFHGCRHTHTHSAHSVLGVCLFSFTVCSAPLCISFMNWALLFYSQHYLHLLQSHIMATDSSFFFIVLEHGPLEDATSQNNGQ